MKRSLLKNKANKASYQIKQALLKNNISKLSKTTLTLKTFGTSVSHISQIGTITVTLQFCRLRMRK